MEAATEGSPRTPNEPDLSEIIRKVVKHLTSKPEPGARNKHVSVDMGVLTKSLIELATNAWRIRNRLIDSTTREPREALTGDDVKKLRRFVDALFAALGDIGLEVKDRTGEAFDYGLPEKVVTTQPQIGITKELIVETIRPTIYWDSLIAQQGEVVIATPRDSAAPKEQ